MPQPPVSPFYGSPRSAIHKLNQMRSVSNSSLSTGDGIVGKSIFTEGSTVRLALEMLLPRLPKTRIGIFEVVSEATGDAVYICRRLVVRNSVWNDAEGVEKLDYKSATVTETEEILNLAECTTSGTEDGALSANDILIAWRAGDDAGTNRWVGIPTVGCSTVRSAEIQSVGAASYTCKLWEWTSGGGWVLASSTITVSPETKIGANDLDGDVWPDLTSGVSIVVFQDLDDSWWSPLVVDDTELCE